MGSEERPTWWRRLVERVFPKTPDFFALLSEQCDTVALSVNDFVHYLETGDGKAAKEVKRDEHAADRIKARNIHLLNEAFSTPIDREDIYRAIDHLDEVVNHCKATVNEMSALDLKPDKRMVEVGRCIRDGVGALVEGFAALGTDPQAAFGSADAARKAQRKVEKAYRRALAELFQGDDYLNMFKRREIYRHVSNCADRMADAANTLHDIIVKIS